MPIMDGLTATQIISEQFVNTKVLIMSIHNEDNYLTTALQVGAKGYLKKNTPARELVNAIYSVYKGYFQLGPGLLEHYLHKIVESQANIQEVERLKSVISQQSKLLDLLNKRSNNYSTANGSSRGKENANISALDGRITTVETQLHHLYNRFEQSNKKYNLTSQFVVILVICNIFSIILFLSLGL